MMQKLFLHEPGDACGCLLLPTDLHQLALSGKATVQRYTAVMSR